LAASTQAAGFVAPNDTHVSTTQWASALLALIAAPVNASNVANIQTWLAHEQDVASWTSGAKGETAQQLQSNPLGVGGAGNHMKNVFSGLLLTAEQLTSPANASYGYGLIVGALRSNKGTNTGPTHAFAAAVSHSGWQNGTNSSYGGSASSFLSVSPLVAGTPGAVDPTPVSSTYTGSSPDVLKKAQQGNPKGWFGQWVEPLLTGSAVGLKNNPAVPITNAVIAPFKAAGTVDQAITDISKNLKNVGIFVLGVALAGTGLLIFFAQTKTAKGVESGVEKAA
jgi:hypothetical protein